MSYDRVSDCPPNTGKKVGVSFINSQMGKERGANTGVTDT